MIKSNAIGTYIYQTFKTVEWGNITRDTWSVIHKAMTLTSSRIRKSTYQKHKPHVSKNGHVSEEGPHRKLFQNVKYTTKREVKHNQHILLVMVLKMSIYNLNLSQGSWVISLECHVSKAWNALECLLLPTREWVTTRSLVKLQDTLEWWVSWEEANNKVFTGVWTDWGVL